MNKRKPSISIILPVYNEAGCIEKLIREIVRFVDLNNLFLDYEIIAVDDGSTDDTQVILKNIIGLKLISIRHDRNFGYGKALMSGVNCSKFDLVLFMDADGQLKIDPVKEFLQYIEDNDIVVGYRYKRQDSLYRILLARLNNLLSFIFFGLTYRDINCGLKLFKKDTLNKEYITQAGVFFTEVLLKAKLRGYRVKEVPVEHYPRLVGKSTGGSLKVIVAAIKDLAFLLIRYHRLKSHM